MITTLLLRLAWLVLVGYVAAITFHNHWWATFTIFIALFIIQLPWTLDALADLTALRRNHTETPLGEMERHGR